MSHLNLKTALATTLCLTSAHLALAFWAPMPLKQLVAANHLIVVGKVETIEKGKPTGGRVMDTASILMNTGPRPRAVQADQARLRRHRR